MYRDEAPRSGWCDILLLAERLAPEVSLLPRDAEQRALTIGLSHEICGEMGFGWCRRLQGVHEGMSGGSAGFPEGVAQYLGAKYGYRAEEAETYQTRAVELLEMLGRRLVSQRDAGSRFYIGSTLSALDIYSATFMALMQPLPKEQCPMPDVMRSAFEASDPATEKALDPILIEHRDFIYDEFLELPLSL
jgi:glutathione S-transferase